MQKRKMNWFRALFIGSVISIAGACSDSNEPSGKGEVEIEITDAPSDDASIKSIMVTVADAKVNGQSIAGFTKQTIDLKAYQDGKTQLLGTTTLDARSYSNLVLVLDLDQDANGNTPGCYVLTNDNVKFKLKSTSTGKTDVIVNQSWAVVSDAKTRMVMDFDLRKAIRYSDDPFVRYSFVSDNSLNAAVRLLTRDKCGAIKGSYQEEQDSNADKIIVYAYKKGTFTASETEPQGVDNITFKNAAASAEVKQTLTGQTYTLAFLQEGEYELYFIAYNKNAETGRYTYAARLQSETSANGSVGNIIKVQAGASISLSTTVKGII